MSFQGPIINITANASQAIAAANVAATAINDAMQRTASNITNQFERTNSLMVSGFRSAFNLIKSAANAFGNFIVTLFGQRISGVIFDTINKFASLENVFRTFSPSTEAAVGQMDFLIQKSSELGFNVTELANSYQKMFVAGSIAGFTTEKIQEVFGSLAEAAAVAGLDSRQLEGALRALHQMMSKGKVQAEELRGQLGEHLPGAFELAARAIGVTTKQLDKMLATGKVTTKMLLENFPAELRKAYGPGLQGALSLPRRELERLKNDISLIIKDLDAGLKVLASSVIILFRRFTQRPSATFIDYFNKAIRELSVLILSIPDFFIAAFDTVIEYFRPIGELIGSIFRSIFEVSSQFFGQYSEQFNALFEFIKFGFIHLPEIVAAAMRGIGAAVITGVNLIKAVFSNFFDIVKNQFVLMGAVAKLSWNGITLSFAEMGNALMRAVDTFTQYIAEKMRSLGTVMSKVGRFEGMGRELIEFADSMTGVTSSMAQSTQDQVDRLMGITRETQNTISSIGSAQLNLIKNTWDNVKHAANQGLESLLAVKSKFDSDVDRKDTAFASIKANLDAALAKNRAIVDSLFAQDKALENIKGHYEAQVQQVNALLDAWQAIQKKIEDSIADSLTDVWLEFVTTGKLSFKDLANSAIADIQRIIFHELIAKQIAASIGASLTGMFSAAGAGQSTVSGGLANLFKSFIPAIFGGFGGGGAAISDVGASAGASLAGNQISTAYLPGFAKGGSFTVGGAGGTDSQLVAFRATPGENVSVGDGNGKGISVVNHFHISTPTGKIPMDSQQQVSARVAAALGRASRRNR